MSTYSIEQIAPLVTQEHIKNIVEETCKDLAQAFITNTAYCMLADDNGELPPALENRMERLRQEVIVDSEETSYFLAFATDILSDTEDLYTNEATEQMMGPFMGKKLVLKVRTIPGYAAWENPEGVPVGELQDELVTTSLLPVIGLLELRESLAKELNREPWGRYQMLLSAVDA